METFKSYVDSWTNFIGTSITGLFLTAATAIFFYAVVRFILKRSSGDTTGLADAKSMLGWSIIGLTVMFSIWGIVSFLQSGILGENAGKTTITAPSISAGGGSSSSGSRNTNTGSNPNYSNEGRNSNTGNTNTVSNPTYSNEGRNTSPKGTKISGASCTISSECISGNCAYDPEVRLKRCK